LVGVLEAVQQHVYEALRPERELKKQLAGRWVQSGKEA
jgi:hypothetical protein